jgi:DNA replication protein DnaC
VAELDPRIRSRLADWSLTQQLNMALPDFRRGGATETRGSHSNLGLNGDMVFETFDLRERVLPEKERRNLREAYEIALSYAQHPENWLIFMGEHGSGKTHLAAAIANYRQRMSEQVVLVTLPDLLDYLRAAFSPHSELPFDRRFDEVRTAALLVIDHLDTSSATPWAREKLRQIVEYRYLTRLPTVFTTVETLDQIDPVVRSRLLDRRRSLIFAILAPDYRGGEAPPRPPHGRR